MVKTVHTKEISPGSEALRLFIKLASSVIIVICTHVQQVTELEISEV